ncbi:MAG: HPr family phosphocarrier protein [Akkermansiaceae bacterium]|nr:HPr family phosphocarrier protein [Akkermansia sp.]MCD7798072.1 HPr family phosphocarrier protein [Akkermansiaceae bacterium]MCD8070700.1 HPr family phosphocarrier protein [Akkermansiaceae bacterium]
MITKSFTIRNKLGIHARPAAQFVRAVSKFASDVSVEREGERVDGKSIMGLMMLAVGCGMVITVTVNGPDEGESMQAIESLIDRKFDED